MQVDHVHDIDAVMLIYNLMEYTDNYSKTSEILWQYWDEQALGANSAITDFNAANAANNLFNLKTKTAVETSNNGTKNVKIMVPLKYLNNFMKTL